MGVSDHWHPVLPSNALGCKPVSVRLCGADIALFRATSGQIGALDDVCPHRRMRLSQGSLVGNRLQCRYHGWTFAPDGQGESPGTPKLFACAASFEPREEHGYIWVKSKPSDPDFPTFDIKGFLPIATVEHRVKAPLELTLDNFCEVEHTPTTHSVFGYELDRMKEVTVRFETTDTSVRVINVGPAKRLGPILSLLLGVSENHAFHDDWTTHFSPVYSVYNHFWTDAVTGAEAMVRWRVYVFFTPVDDGETRITTFAYAKSRWPIGPAGGLRPMRFFIRRKIDQEIQADIQMLSGLADYDTKLEGMKLSRFDRALGLNRERIERIYRGKTPVAEPG